VLGGVTGAAFGRVLQGRPASIRLVTAGAIAVILAEVFRRRNVLLSTLVSAAALLVALGLMVFPDTTWNGVPTPDTLRELGKALGSLGREAAREVAPAPALPSLMAASITAVWAASAAAHALAVRSRSAILPVLPPAALLAFAGVVTGDGPRPGFAAALLLASGAVLVGVAAERMTLWGRVVQRPGRTRRRLLGATAARWAAGIGVSALFVALILPGILPGYEAGAMIDFRNGRGDSVVISPIVDIRPSIRQNPAARLFTVQADRPAYWRLVALDRFDGLVWTATDLYAEEGTSVEGSATLPGSPARGATLTQAYRIDELGTKWLPAAFEPQSVVVEDGLRYAAETGVLVRPEGVVEGFTYQVTSELLAPTASDLNAVELAAEPETYLQLPADLPDSIRELTEEIVEAAGATTMYEKALAIQEHLRTFTYDDAIPAGHANRDLIEFLLNTQRGYCEQFAGAMAVMLRSLGIPARVAVGFLPGAQVAQGTFMVSSRDAHAWPEVFFGDLGWIPFEPTPTRENPVGGYLGTGGTAPPAEEGGGAPRQQQNQNRGPGQRFNADESTQTGAREAPGTFRRIIVSRPEPPFPWVRVLLALAATAAVVLLYTAVAKGMARRLALRRDAGVLRAYRVFQATAADLGVARRPAETLDDYRRRLRSTVAFGDGHLDRLTELTTLAAYGPRAPSASDGREAVTAAREVTRDLRRHAGPLRRAMGAVLPTPPF
jgi:transglutaminase-like putative cysteine protease